MEDSLSDSEAVNGNSPWGRMGVVLEKFGLSIKEFMHGTNYINIDMMLIDNPRMLTDKEKEKAKKVVVNDAEQMEKELNKMFNF